MSQKNYERSRYKEPVLVLQGHPAQWDSTHLLEFRRILQFLQSENAVFMKPTEYLEYAVRTYLSFSCVLFVVT